MQFKNAFRLKEKNEKECTIADRQRRLYYHGHARPRWHPRGSLFPEGKAEPVVRAQVVVALVEGRDLLHVLVRQGEPELEIKNTSNIFFCIPRY